MSDNEKKLITPYEIVPEGYKPFGGKSFEELVNPVETIPEGTKSFEEKLYIILIKNDTDDELFDGNYIIANGRTDCYRKIQHLLEALGEEVDIHESRVIVETNDLRKGKPVLMPWNDCLSIYSLCKSIQDYYTGVDKFDIEEYNLARTYENTEDDNIQVDNSVSDEYLKELGITKEEFSTIGKSLIKPYKELTGHDFPYDPRDETSKYHINLPILKEDDDKNNV